MIDILVWIQSWFASQCNEEWEHLYGIKIDTLDNPGWSVVIDLTGTYLENKSMEPMSVDRTEDDWMQCSVSHNQFKGYGDPQKLEEILGIFRAWVESLGCRDV